MQKRRTRRQAFWDSLPVMAGYLVLGFGFGVLLERAGYPFYWAVLMSAVIYAGSMQYVAVSLLSGGASLLVCALMTLTVNARHLFYGIAMLEKYRGLGRARPYLIFSLTDETFSLVSRPLPAGLDRRCYYLTLSILNHGYWIAGSALGGLFGQLVSFDSRGIDFAMTALFVVIFVEQWLSSRQHLPALLGLGLSALCLAVFRADFVIPAMLCIAAALLLLRRPLERKEADGNAG